MVIKLIQKDLLLIKHHIIFLLLLAAIIPAFFSNATGIKYDYLLTLTVIITVLSAYQDISIEEEKFSNATMLLCTLPTSRELMVFAKYLFGLFSYIICIIIYFVVSLSFGKNIHLNFKLFSQNLYFLLLILSICIPLQYRFGHSVVKYIFSLTCISVPFIISYLSKLEIHGSNLSIWYDLGFLIFSIILYYLSYFISCIIFNKREF